MTSFYRHYFHANWSGQLKSCVRDIIYVSPPPPSPEHGRRRASILTRCVTMRRRQDALQETVIEKLRVEIGSDSSDRSLDHSKGKN